MLFVSLKKERPRKATKGHERPRKATKGHERPRKATKGHKEDFNSFLSFTAQKILGRDTTKRSQYLLFVIPKEKKKRRLIQIFVSFQRNVLFEKRSLRIPSLYLFFCKGRLCFGFLKENT